MREPPNERRSLGAEAAREQGVLSGPDSLSERARIAKGQESLRRMSLLWSRWQVNAEGVCCRALSDRACVSPCVPPGGRVRTCVAAFVSPKAKKADNWRRHVPQSGDYSGERLQCAAREVHEIIKEIIITILGPPALHLHCGIRQSWSYKWKC